MVIKTKYDMKKKYFEPQIEVIELLSEEMLLLSTSVGEDATGPANAREFLDDWDDDLYED